MVSINIKILESGIPGDFLERAVVAPYFITVHLGTPTEIAENITVPFIDYIKNVASSELYPTWHENALRANIHAIVSIALNRYFTEWYRAKGFNFDITNSTQYDQSFVPGRDIYDSISIIVDEIFNQYIVLEGNIEPFFATFCDGITVQCDGMSQWGSVQLANEGYTPIEILKYYYGENINIKLAPVGEPLFRYKETLEKGDSGFDVLRKELQLNRISMNFPAIPKIDPADGYYNDSTEAAVKEFQKIFNLPVTGIIDRSTWYKISYIYIAVAKLSETTSEGIFLKQYEDLLENILLKGDVRPRVTLLQYFLVLLSLYYPTVPEVNITGTFDEQTRLSVIEYQKTLNLPPTGIVDEATWESIYSSSLGIIRSLSPEAIFLPYLRYVIDYKLGDKGPGVFIVQIMLQYISTVLPEIPFVQLTEIYDETTENAVIQFQNFYGIEPTGIVDETTWNAIAEIYRTQRYQSKFT